MEIIIENYLDVNYNYPHTIYTTLCVGFGKGYFPDKEWIDFTFPVLEWWKRELLAHKNISNCSFILYFEDGPYHLHVKKDSNMQLVVDCMISRVEKNVCVETAYVSYNEFLECLYKTYKLLAKLLYKDGINIGVFKPIYDQILKSIKEIKSALQSFE